MIALASKGNPLAAAENFEEDEATAEVNARQAGMSSNEFEFVRSLPSHPVGTCTLGHCEPKAKLLQPPVASLIRTLPFGAIRPRPGEVRGLDPVGRHAPKGGACGAIPKVQGLVIRPGHESAIWKHLGAFHPT